MTLDGKPAQIRYYISETGKCFALVFETSGKGGDVEYSKAAADRIITQGGNFIS